MRPIKLTMQAFGPYAGTETIDFTQLGNRTMFVISGKTGSGKTTIFDGISYAIYGKASGEDRHGPELRSQFAKDDLLTEVSLHFSLRGTSYFIKRTPQQEKKKERGDGFTTIGAKAELYLFTEDGEMKLLASKVSEVEEKIKQIMLIDSNQFRQILMIPQGEFRKLLTSDSKEKEAILQRLFHTEIYKRVEEKLKDEAADLKRAVEKQVEARHSLIRRIHAPFSEELQAYLAADSTNDVLIFPLLEQEIALITEELEKMKTELKGKEKEKELFSQKLYEAENLMKQLETREQLKSRKQMLEAEKEQIDEKEEAIILANKAKLLAKQEELCHRLKREWDALVRDAEQREERVNKLQSLLAEKEQAFQTEKEREPERKRAQEALHTLQQMKGEVYQYAELEKTVEKQAKLVNEKSQILKQAEKELETLNEKTKELQEERATLENVGLLLLENERGLEKLEHETNLLAKYEEQLTRLINEQQQETEKKSLFEQVDSRLKDARLLVENLESQWLHGQAANLASRLQEGEACPVCGSEHHPNPALIIGEGGPDEKDLKAAKEQVRLLEKERTMAESAYLSVHTRTQSLAESLQETGADLTRLYPHFSNETLMPIKNGVNEQKEKLKEEKDRLNRGKNRLEKITLDLKEIEQIHEEAAKKIKDLQELINQATISFTEKNTSLNGMKSRIPEELRTVQAFEQQWKKVLKQQETLQAKYEQSQKEWQTTKEQFSSETSGMQTVKKHASAKEEELKVEREAFRTEMKKQGFLTYQEYAEAKRTEEQIAQLEREIRTYHEELRSVTDRYHELQEALKDAEMPNLEQLKEALNNVQQQLDELNNQYTELFMKKRENEEMRDGITRINSELKELENRYKLVGELSDVSRGQNALRITFERYVLASFLDEILEEANTRLEKMTSGRYRMVRKTDRAKGNAQSGLELLVFDQYTGQERHVKTLSGGESFKAALSLALGLADVVQSHAGGVSLETMFIDEGFGTLDPESLDQAIEALIDIQGSGRLVGIISHVPELRERIDARLEVTATQTGSTTKFQFLN